MKSRNLVLLFLVVFALVAVEGSVFVRTSLLRERRGLIDDECFTCKAEDRPFYYPLMKYFNKVKDVFVKGFNVIAEKAKEYKITGK